MSALTSLFVSLHIWRLSYVTVHCSPSPEDSSVLGSTSTCFVLLIDFKSSGIASVVAYPLLQFKSLLREKRFQLIEVLNCFFRCFHRFDEIVHVGVFLYCLCCNWIHFFVVQSHSLENIVCTSWRTLSSRYMTLIFVYLNRFISPWAP